MYAIMIREIRIWRTHISHVVPTRRERLKSALYLRLKKGKAQSFENCERVDPFGFLKIQFVAKYLKKIEGGPFGDIKKRHQKIRKIFLKKKMRISKQSGSAETKGTL